MSVIRRARNAPKTARRMSGGTRGAGTSNNAIPRLQGCLGTLDHMGEPEDAQDSGPKVQSPRARRIPRSDLRERILREGSALLSATGVTASLDHVNMDELIRRVGVPRSSVFAAFGSKEELITELMVQLLRRGPESRGPAYSPIIANGMAVLAEHGSRLRRPDGTRDPDGEHAVFREIVRVVLAHNADAMRDSLDWQTYMALSASVLSLPAARRERVRTALRESEEEMMMAMVGFHAAALSAVGRRLLPGLDMRQLVTAGSSLIDGLVSRRRIGIPVVERMILEPGIDGEPVEWTLVARAYLSVVEGMTEPVPL